MEEIKINCRWTSQSLEVLKIVPENTLRILRVIYDVFCSVPVLAEKQSTLLQIIYTMFCMFLLHALHVPPACSTCSFYMFSMFKGHVLHVPFACSGCHFTFTLRTSVSHNSLKSSPIYTIFIYLSSLYWDLDVHIACEEILWIFLSSSFWQCEAVEHL